MNTFLKGYLGEDISIQERLFYIATFTSSISCLLFVFCALLAHIDLIVVGAFGAVTIVSTILFFAQKKKQRTNLNIFIFLVFLNILVFPTLLVISPKNTVEFPIYFLTGITFGLILLEGYKRYVYFAAQLIVDFAACYYAFIYRVQFKEYYLPLTTMDFVRIEGAVLISGILCGIMLNYRNKLILQALLLEKEAGDTAEKVSYAKDMFLVNVSHEIRTPLNAIIGTTEMVLDSNAGNHVKEMAFNISNSSHALLSITTDLLDFSRMNIDQLKVNEGKFDIALMFSDIINLMSIRLLDSNVDFFVRINPELPKMLVGDSGKIRQIVINMLSNAIKYTKEGHMLLAVDFDYDAVDKVKLKIKVEDTGIGIKEDAIDKIFIPYNRSGDETDRLIEGNGLGLALCKRLADLMHGKIYVESTYGFGSTFFFDVPLMLETPYVGGVCGGLKEDNQKLVFYINNNQERIETKSIFEEMNIDNTEAVSLEDFCLLCRDDSYSFYLIDSSSFDRVRDELKEAQIDWSKFVVISGCNYSYSGEPFEYVLTKPVSCLNVADLINQTQGYATYKQINKKTFTIPDCTILIVDDNLVNLEVAASMMSKYDAKIITAASGKECLITLEQEKVDIIYLDYMMPGMDGIDTLKAIRRLPGDIGKDIPVIALTANVVSGAREMFMKAGFNEYLSKPIESERLELTLRDFIDESKIVYERKVTK